MPSLASNKENGKTYLTSTNHRDHRQNPEYERDKAQDRGRFIAASASNDEHQRRDGEPAEDQQTGEESAQTVATATIEMIEQLHGRHGQHRQNNRDAGIQHLRQHVRRTLERNSQKYAITMSSYSSELTQECGAHRRAAARAPLV